MEKRNYKRFSTDIHVTFCCCATDYYSGTATNMSDKGMFINTNMCFPLESDLDILILLNEEMLRVPVKVRWLRKFSEIYDGVGVEVQNSPQKFLEFIDSLR